MRAPMSMAAQMAELVPAEADAPASGDEAAAGRR